MQTPLISFVLATYNRGQVLVDCLRRTMAAARDVGHEIIVVDNASTDGTVEVLEGQLPEAKVIRLERNEGPVAKNHGVRRARGEYVVFLDDDAYPEMGAVGNMVKHFAADAALGAAVFDVRLPDGRLEGSAYPEVFIGAGTGFRRTVLEAVGLLPAHYFMQAEEYDLSFRIIGSGWRIVRFGDMPLVHLKTPGARVGTRTTRLDMRNNLFLLATYVPEPLCFSLAADWLARYEMMARARDAKDAVRDFAQSHRRAYLRGMMVGLGAWSRLRRRENLLDGQAVEKIFKFEETRRRLEAVCKEHQLRRICFADFGKNMLAYYRAARELRVEVTCVMDDALAAPMGQRPRDYRGIPIVTVAAGRQLPADGVVISNLSPTQAAGRAAALRGMDVGPVFDLFADRR